MKTKQNWKTETVGRSFTEACLASCRKVLDRLSSAKEAILDEFGQSLSGNRHLLELAVNEAEAIAWETEVPHLVFPQLATEKAQAVAAWSARQNMMRSAHAALAA